jgi:hypothetical protein
MAFRELGCEYVWADACGPPLDQRTWFAGVRLSQTLETTYGFTRELIVYYTPFEDLQSRMLHDLRLLIRQESRRLPDPDHAFFFAPDPLLVDKLDDWSTPALTLLPLPDMARWEPSGRANALLEMVHKRIFYRDLYLETTPVSGQRFFGRNKTVQALLDDIRERRSPAIFGLRKAGKTSLIYEVRELLQKRHQNYVFVLRDLEYLPSPPTDCIPDLLIDLRRDIMAAISERNYKVGELGRLSDEDPSIARFRRALQNTLRENPSMRLVLALDEIEYLTPPSLLRHHQLESVPQFLGALRSLVQESDSFVFILSGMTSWIVESGMIGGRPNPMYSWAKPYFAGPFSADDTRDLVTTLGKKMGVEWSDEALALLRQYSGGHPYLLRNLASRVTRSLPRQATVRQVSPAAVQAAVPAWKLDVAGNFAEIVDHVRRYYPEELVLVELLIESPGEFPDFAVSEPLALSHLLHLGVIAHTEDSSYEASYAISEFLRRVR